MFLCILYVLYVLFPMTSSLPNIRIIAGVAIIHINTEIRPSKFNINFMLLVCAYVGKTIFRDTMFILGKHEMV